MTRVPTEGICNANEDDQLVGIRIVQCTSQLCNVVHHNKSRRCAKKSKDNAPCLQLLEHLSAGHICHVQALGCCRRQQHGGNVSAKVITWPATFQQIACNSIKILSYNISGWLQPCEQVQNLTSLSHQVHIPRQHDDNLSILMLDDTMLSQWIGSSCRHYSQSSVVLS